MVAHTLLSSLVVLLCPSASSCPNGSYARSLINVLISWDDHMGHHKHYLCLGSWSVVVLVGWTVPASARLLLGWATAPSIVLVFACLQNLRRSAQGEPLSVWAKSTAGCFYIQHVKISTRLFYEVIFIKYTPTKFLHAGCKIFTDTCSTVNGAGFWGRLNQNVAAACLPGPLWYFRVGSYFRKV